MSKVPQTIIDLYHDFTHGAMDRRALMERLAVLAGGTAAAQAVLPLLQNNYAIAQTVAENDPRIAAESVTFAGPDGTMGGYLVRGKGGAKRPAVIVIHENRGLNPHIKDVTRRVALAGYLALGIDALLPDGGTPTDEDKGRDMIGKVSADKATARIAAAVPFLAAHAESTGKIGAVGFCWGGGQVNALAATGTIAAGAAYYGRQVPAEKVPAIKAALLLHYAEKDDGINAGIAAYEAALKANGKAFELFQYPGTQHAFNNDTNAARYNEAAAKLAWERTLGHFAKHLGDPPKVG